MTAFDSCARLACKLKPQTRYWPSLLAVILAHNPNLLHPQISLLEPAAVDCMDTAGDLPRECKM